MIAQACAASNVRALASCALSREPALLLGSMVDSSRTADSAELEASHQDYSAVDSFQVGRLMEACRPDSRAEWGDFTAAKAEWLTAAAAPGSAVDSFHVCRLTEACHQDSGGASVDSLAAKAGATRVAADDRDASVVAASCNTLSGPCTRAPAIVSIPISAD